MAGYRHSCFVARFLGLIVCLFVSFFVVVPGASAETAKPLKVGVSEFRPLVHKEGGSFTGFDIDLWEKAAAKLDLKFEYVPMPFKDLLVAMEKGEVDVGLGGISITASREAVFDFSHHYFDSGLLAAVSTGTSANLLSALKALGSRSIMMLFLGFIAFTVFCAHLLWLSERGASAIDDSYFPGIFEAFWCTIATATTVGYGDVVPKKLLGRIAALFVMLAGIGFFGILSAELMSLLTTLRLNSVIQSSKDLSEKTVATVRGTTSVSELKSLGAFVIENDSIEESFRLLNQDKVTAVVFDAPVIRYYVKEGMAGTASIAGHVFAEQYYGIALQEGSTIREPLNRAILEMRNDGTYDRLYRRWFSDND